MSNEHIEPATKEYEGQLYQLDQGYLFSNNQKHWMFTFLIDIDKTCNQAFVTSQQSFLYIKKLPTSEHIGTIKPAPIELIDGAAYMFDEQEPYSNKNCIGIYEKHEHKFHLKNYATLVKVCTNIRLMTVESK
jgi:hypothetical protein